MGCAGLRKEAERADVIAYLNAFSADGSSTAAPPAAAATPAAATPQAATAVPAEAAPLPEHGLFHLGRAATPEEVAAWDLDVRPDGAGLPAGSGTVAAGGVIFPAA